MGIWGLDLARCRCYKGLGVIGAFLRVYKGSCFKGVHRGV